jgi:mannose-1-phosphate guanylyltransferase
MTEITMNNTYILLMAGGLGSRFWPKSRESYPKQFIDILGTGESLLQQTAKRFKGLCEMDHVFVLTNENYKDLVQKQLPEIPPQNILLEPSRNNTAPCIAYASYKIYSLNPNANIVVSPSDQLILKEEEFRLHIQQAIDFASTNNALLTLGISPTRPDTGYGYIHYEANEQGVCKVNKFLEKPVLEKAKMYVDSGSYLWNAGIFIWNVKAILEALETHANDVAVIFKEGLPFYGTSAESDFIQAKYPTSPNISIDYAIMEKATNVYTIPASIGWSDLGTWASLYEVMPKDVDENASNTESTLLIDTQNNMIHLPAHKVALVKGLKDYIVVDDGKVLLIVPKEDEQNIKLWSKQMIENFGKEYC